MKEKKPIVCSFLCDQHARDGFPVPFLGRPACTVPVPATLMLKYEAPLILLRGLRRKAGSYRVEMDVLDPTPYRAMPRDEAVRAVTLRINRYIEDTIQGAPEQWTWAHRRWRECCGAAGCPLR